MKLKEEVATQSHRQECKMIFQVPNFLQSPLRSHLLFSPTPLEVQQMSFIWDYFASDWNHTGASKASQQATSETHSTTIRRASFTCIQSQLKEVHCLRVGIQRSEWPCNFDNEGTHAISTALPLLRRFRLRDELNRLIDQRLLPQKSAQ